MPSVMAIISKAVFEKAARGLDVGDVWDTDHYGSHNKGLAPVGDGGDLYLVTVRPPETLWLVAVLRSPRATGDAWKAEANTVAIRAIDELRSRIKFTSGVGITQKPGALGMSLQTPRVLTDDDVALLGGSAPTKPATKTNATTTVKPKPALQKTTAKPVRAGDDFASAVASAEANDWPAVLATCLAIWRAAPNNQLADLIIGISKALPPLEIDPKDWLATANKQRPETLDGLLASIFEKGSVQARAFVEALAKWPNDPRIDRWVAGLFKDPVYSSTTARPLWTRIQLLTKRIVDSVAIATIATARAGNWRHCDFTTDFLREYVDRAKLVAGPEAAVDAAALASIAKQIGNATAKPVTGKRADALLEQYLAAPDDDQLPVLADALIEAGDLRGELINLQMGEGSAATTKRANAIIESSRAALLGPLDAATTDVTFAKGFAARAKLRRSTSAAAARAVSTSVGHPLWSTVEHLEGPDDREITLHPVMHSLRSIKHTDVALKELASRSRLEALDVVGIDAPEASVLFGQGFTALKHLAVQFRSGYPNVFGPVRSMLTSPLAARLEALEIGFQLTALNQYNPQARVQFRTAESAGLAELLPLAAKLDAQVTLRLLRHPEREIGSSFELVHTKDGIAVSIRVLRTTHETLEPDVGDDILAVLTGIATIKAVEVSLDGPPKSKVVKQAIEGRLATFA